MVLKNNTNKIIKTYTKNKIETHKIYMPLKITKKQKKLT